jgi:adenosylhomocysteine nucleosidase
MARKFLFLLFVIPFSCTKETPKIIILISANAEWKVVKSVFPKENYQSTPWGEFFQTEIKSSKEKTPVILFHEGWGKTAAAGATQFAIDKWNPEYLINLGTCGGFEGKINRYDIVLVNKTIIYDIKEAMGNSKEAIDDYTTAVDLSWLKVNTSDSVNQTLLVSADRDLVPEEVEALEKNYNAIAGDWESGSIAYTCKRNNKKILILRGVTDLVTSTGGEAYSNNQVFQNGTEIVMKKLIRQLPHWLDKIPDHN